MFNKIINLYYSIKDSTGVALKTHKSELYVGGGALSIVAGVIFACKATLKCDEIIEEHRDTMDKIHRTDEDYPEYKESGDMARDTVVAAVKTGGKLVWNYSGAAGLILGGLYFMYKGYKNEKTAKEDVIVGFNALKTVFDGYRGRVREYIGEEEEEALYLGKRPVVKQHKIIDSDTGEITEENVKELIFDDDDLGLPSPYAKYFQVGNPNWCSKEKYGPDFIWYNVNWLKCQQVYINQMLRTRGYVLLSDVYELLGLEANGISHMVGWLDERIDGSKDGYIDFGIYDISNKNTRDFINESEKEAILLDFNVDGIIIDKIDTITKKVGCRW